MFMNKPKFQFICSRCCRQTDLITDDELKNIGWRRFHNLGGNAIVRILCKECREKQQYELYSEPMPKCEKMIFYIVFLNDSPMFVLTDEGVAKQKLVELKEEYFEKNRWHFNNDREEYNVGCIWHIRDVKGVL